MRLYFSSIMARKKISEIEDSIEHLPKLYFSKSHEDAVNHASQLCYEAFPKHQGYTTHNVTIDAIALDEAKKLLQYLQNLIQSGEYM